MLRICLFIAIVAGLAAGAVSFFKVQDIITTTRQERNDWHQKDDQEVAAHTKTKKTLKETAAKLDTTEKELAQTKSDLDAANGKVADLTKRSDDLTAKLDKTTAERDDAQQQLARWSGLPDPALIRGIIADLEKTRKAQEALIGENKLLASKVTEWENRWNNFFQGDADVILPTGLRGKVIAVDPKYNFVVLNIGEDQGVKERGVMMINHDGRLLGKVRIKSVSKDRCVANILTDWKRGEVMEGDEVLY
jgi:cell shape-determining protein MreC